jgi:hypothetical protein
MDKGCMCSPYLRIEVIVGSSYRLYRQVELNCACSFAGYRDPLLIARYFVKS